MSHALIADDKRAACACRRWLGVIRQDAESLGAFTLRARDLFDAHKAAAIALHAVQVSLFDQTELF